MTLFDVVLIVAVTSLVIMLTLIFTIGKGVGFRMLFSTFKVKMKKRKGWGFVRMINQTGVPENIAYHFNGKELLLPLGEGGGNYIYKPHCLSPNEYDIPTITFRKGDAEPIDPRTGLQTVTSGEMIEEIIARAIKAEKMTGSDLKDWLEKNWLKIAIGLLCLVGGFLFVYMHMTDAIVEAGKSASQTLVLNATSLGK